MRASIMSYAKGIQMYQDVQMVRVKSKDYNLLIMDGFVPTLGKIEGTVTVLTHEEEKVYKDIEGYFQQKDNVFSLLISEIGNRTE